jgi:hypothetical protein
VGHASAEVASPPEPSSDEHPTLARAKELVARAQVRAQGRERDTNRARRRVLFLVMLASGEYRGRPRRRAVIGADARISGSFCAARATGARRQPEPPGSVKLGQHLSDAVTLGHVETLPARAEALPTP